MSSKKLPSSISDSPRKKKWRVFTVRSQGPSLPESWELSGTWCLEQGASGTAVEPSGDLKAYFQLTDSERDSLYAAAMTEGYELLDECDVPEQNWVQECEDLWQPQVIGALTITPILSPEGEAASGNKGSTDRPDQIRIVPGFGFGTGHHPTTSMILQELQVVRSERESLSNSPNHSADLNGTMTALDIGTGSGILAIAVAKLFGCRVVAIDPDYDALRNAQENLSLNTFEHTPLLVCAEMSAIDGEYPIIVANLYAELLELIADSILARLSSGGQLVLSGIAEPYLDSVRAHYRERSLELVSQNLTAGWAMLRYRRPHGGPV